MPATLSGVLFMLSGEPCSQVQRGLIEASGARLVVGYAFFEAGAVAFGCAEAREADDLHLLRDRYALVQRNRTVDQADVTVDAFLFTTFYRATSKILLNAEVGDYGVPQDRACGCLLGELGFTQHLSRIRSFEKLTSEGMSFVNTQLQWVLEEALPARFGGTVADYQVVEREGKDGIRRLHLMVHPRLGALDEADLQRTFLDNLGGTGELESYKVNFWRRAGTVQVERQAPLATGAGKVFPFHLIEARSTVDGAKPLQGG
jgi:hypothetical protein